MYLRPFTGKTVFRILSCLFIQVYVIATVPGNVLGGGTTGSYTVAVEKARPSGAMSGTIRLKMGEMKDKRWDEIVAVVTEDMGTGAAQTMRPHQAWTRGEVVAALTGVALLIFVKPLEMDVGSRR